MKPLFVLLCFAFLSLACAAPESDDPTEDCKLAPDVECAASGKPVYVCLLSDGSECWYKTDDIEFPTNSSCVNDDSQWEDAAESLAEYCEG